MEHLSSDQCDNNKPAVPLKETLDTNLPAPLSLRPLVVFHLYLALSRIFCPLPITWAPPHLPLIKTGKVQTCGKRPCNPNIGWANHHVITRMVTITKLDTWRNAPWRLPQRAQSWLRNRAYALFVPIMWTLLEMSSLWQAWQGACCTEKCACTSVVISILQTNAIFWKRFMHEMRVHNARFSINYANEFGTGKYESIICKLLFTSLIINLLQSFESYQSLKTTICIAPWIVFLYTILTQNV